MNPAKRGALGERTPSTGGGLLGGKTNSTLDQSPPKLQAKANYRRQESDRRRAAFAREVALTEFKDKRAGWLTLSRLVWGRS
jgi:hypothetical protein